MIGGIIGSIAVGLVLLIFALILTYSLNRTHARKVQAAKIARGEIPPEASAKVCTTKEGSYTENSRFRKSFSSVGNFFSGLVKLLVWLALLAIIALVGSALWEWYNSRDIAKTEISIPITEGEWEFQWFRTAKGAAEGRRDEGKLYPAKIIAYSDTVFVWEMSFKHNGRPCKANFAWDRSNDPSKGQWNQPKHCNERGKLEGSWSTTGQGVTDEEKDYFIGWVNDQRGMYYFRLIKK